jgi:hypothetical protein
MSCKNAPRFETAAKLLIHEKKGHKITFVLAGPSVPVAAGGPSKYSTVEGKDRRISASLA